MNTSETFIETCCLKSNCNVSDTCDCRYCVREDCKKDKCFQQTVDTKTIVFAVTGCENFTDFIDHMTGRYGRKYKKS